MICIFKCPSCGDQMTYSLEKQCLVCSTCGAEIDADEYNTDDITYEGVRQLEEGISEFTCPSCGCNMLTDRSSAKHTCSYCGAEMIEFGTAKGELSPEYIIPCKLTKDEARTKVISWWMDHESMPQYNPNCIKLEFRSFYLPVWLCDVDVIAHMSGTVAYSSGRRKPENYSPLYGNNGKDDVNRIISEKTLKSTFLRLPVNSSTHFSANRFRGVEPFNYKDLEEFNPVYLSGHNAEKTEFSQSDMVPQAKRLACDYGLKQVRYHLESMAFDYVKLESVATSYAKACPSNMVYALLPIWICSYRYKGRRHYIYVNGQTGKTDGEILISKKLFGIDVCLYSLATLLFTIGLLFNIFSLSPLIGNTASSMGAYLFGAMASIGYDALRYVLFGKRKIINEKFSNRRFQVYIPSIIKAIIGAILLPFGLENAEFFYRHNMLEPVGTLTLKILFLSLILAAVQAVLFAIRRKRFLLRRNLPEYSDYLEMGNTKIY